MINSGLRLGSARSRCRLPLVGVGRWMGVLGGAELLKSGFFHTFLYFCRCDSRVELGGKLFIINYVLILYYEKWYFDGGW